MAVVTEQDEEVCREVLQILSRIGDEWSLTLRQPERVGANRLRIKDNRLRYDAERS